MGAILGDDKAAIRNITQMFPDITKEMLATGGETVSIHSAFKDKKYRVDMKEIHTEEAQAAASQCAEKQRCYSTHNGSKYTVKCILAYRDHFKQPLEIAQCRMGYKN